MPGTLDLLHTLHLILDRGTVATPWVAPGDHRTIGQNRGECRPSGLNLLHVPKLICDCRAITTVDGIAPCDYPVTSTAPQRKGTLGCSQLCFLWNDCEVVSILNPSVCQRFRRSYDMACCCHQP